MTSAEMLREHKIYRLQANRRIYTHTRVQTKPPLLYTHITSLSHREDKTTMLLTPAEPQLGYRYYNLQEKKEKGKKG